MTAPFVYQPLAGSETRLFSIEPGKVDDPLRVQLRHIRLETTPTYHALSYVWGDSNDKVQISVNDVPFSIPRNLYNALGQLREILIAKKEEGFLFWADSISINQQDEAEKSREVLRMGEIYQSAYQVTGWLGMAEDLDPIMIETVFEKAVIIRRIVERSSWDSTELEKRLPGFIPLIKDKLGNEFGHFMNTLFGIFQRDFFKRIWIVQEAALATPHKMFMLLEKYMTDSLVYLWFAAAGWPILRRKFIKYQGIAAFDRIRGARIQRQSQVSSDKGNNLSTFAHRLDEMLALSFEGAFHATRPHDHVYALLGMAEAPKDLPVELLPNYSKPYADICFDYTKFIVEHTGTLSILSRLGTKLTSNPDVRLFVNERDGIPSWVPDLRARTLLYHAPDTKASVSFSGSGKCMTVEGVSLGNPISVVQPQTLDQPFLPHDVRAKKIEKRILKPAAIGNNLSYKEVYLSWLSSFSVNDAHRDLPIDIFERLFAKIEEDPYERRFRENGDEDGEIEETLFDIQQHIELEIYSDAQFLTTDGFIGCLKRSCALVRKDDVVCILKGMSSAALLRPCGMEFMFVGVVQLRCPLRDANFDEDFFSNYETHQFNIV